MAGWRPEEVLGRPIWEFMDDEAAAMAPGELTGFLPRPFGVVGFLGLLGRILPIE